MTSTTHSPNVTVDLYVRSLSPAGGQRQLDAVITRLERLATTGRIAEFTVHVWGKQIATSSVATRTTAGQAILDTVDEFRAWAREHGRSLRSFFDTRDVRSRITGEDYTALVLPTMTLAEYHGDDLRFVAPCADGDTMYSVTDRLDTLEAEDQTVDQEPPSVSETLLVADQ